ncbi:MAG TPA: SEC-C metal-binding domain-containing protein [Thermodesulfovibrionales bacterium]|nr:SEC-C metal-binding domain-containing protein [Thermodesulfovibrionales bacterium]
MTHTGRNDPCPCGSGKKYKNCCLNRSGRDSLVENINISKARRDDDIIPVDSVIDYGQPFTDAAFFDTNNVHDFSGTRLIYSLILNPHVEELAHKTVRGFLNRGKEEMDRIINADKVRSVIEIMRRNPDPINNEPLMKKLVRDKEQAVPMMLRELREPQNDSFVELSARILHRTGTNYSKDIIDIIKSGNNRRAYAISVLCVLLGFYDNDESGNLLWAYYHYMKNTYPNDTYSDGPLLGLIEIRDRKRQKASLN